MVAQCMDGATLSGQTNEESAWHHSEVIAVTAFRPCVPKREPCAGFFLDEVEATGTEVTGQLEHNVRCHVPAKSPFNYKDKKIRLFGGVNA